MRSSSAAMHVEAVGKVLLIGVTGGTGSNAVKGLLEQNVSDLRAITRTQD